MPLYEAHRAFVLGAATLHADETPVNMLDPGMGKTKRAYVWAYARSSFDVQPGVAYDFCIGRAAKYPAVSNPKCNTPDPKELHDKNLSTIEC